VQYGLYTAFAGPIIYAVFGSVKQITMGPTAVMALMTFQYTSKGGAPYAIVLSFLAGCLEFIAGVLNLGKCLGFFLCFFQVLVNKMFRFYRFPS
jgi:sodium-independent sulfate anion transporter 11